MNNSIRALRLAMKNAIADESLNSEEILQEVKSCLLETELKLRDRADKAREVSDSIFSLNVAIPEPNDLGEPIARFDDNAAYDPLRVPSSLYAGYDTISFSEPRVAMDSLSTDSDDPISF